MMTLTPGFTSFAGSIMYFFDCARISFVRYSAQLWLPRSSTLFGSVAVVNSQSSSMMSSKIRASERMRCASCSMSSGLL